MFMPLMESPAAAPLFCCWVPNIISEEICVAPVNDWNFDCISALCASAFWKSSLEIAFLPASAFSLSAAY